MRRHTNTKDSAYLNPFPTHTNGCFSFLVLYILFGVSHKQKAICFTAFLVGFITVLCIGNYFRAKRAQDRQRQRRLAKLADDSTFVGTDSNGNPYAPQQQQQQGGTAGNGGGNGDYAPPRLSPASATGVQV